MDTFRSSYQTWSDSIEQVALKFALRSREAVSVIFVRMLLSRLISPEWTEVRKQKSEIPLMWFCLSMQRNGTNHRTGWVFRRCHTCTREIPALLHVSVSCFQAVQKLFLSCSMSHISKFKGQKADLRHIQFAILFVCFLLLRCCVCGFQLNCGSVGKDPPFLSDYHTSVSSRFTCILTTYAALLCGL